MNKELPKNISRNLCSVFFFAAILGLGYIDYITSDYSLILFYILVAVAATWYLNIRHGISSSILSVILQAISDYNDHHDEVFQAVYYWNWGNSLVIMIVICLFVHIIKCHEISGAHR